MSSKTVNWYEMYLVTLYINCMYCMYCMCAWKVVRALWKKQDRCGWHCSNTRRGAMFARVIVRRTVAHSHVIVRWADRHWWQVREQIHWMWVRIRKCNKNTVLTTRLLQGKTFQIKQIVTLKYVDSSKTHQTTEASHLIAEVFLHRTSCTYCPSGWESS